MRRSSIGLLVGAADVAPLAGALPLCLAVHQSVISGYFTGAAAMLGFALVGTLVAWRRPELRMGWLLLAVSGLLALSSFGGFYSEFDYTKHHGHLPLGPLALLVQPFWLGGFAVMIVAIVLYPNGLPPSRRWRLPLRLFGGVVLANLMAISALVSTVTIRGTVRVESGGDLYQVDHPYGLWAPMVELLTILALFGALALIITWFVSQLTGYRTLQGERRVQQKWILTGALVAILALLTNLLPYPFSSTTSRLSVSDFTSLGLIALPVAMGIGILRYRLYEIDRIVSRTLSYAILTALLAATFVGLVVLSTRVLPFSSEVGVAASTLVAAALFNPLRRRIQHRVDRRFNRARYDAETTVAAFAQRLRDAVDLHAVQSDLLATVDRALEPAHATVWLRAGEPR